MLEAHFTECDCGCLPVEIIFKTTCRFAFKNSYKSLAHLVGY